MTAVKVEVRSGAYYDSTILMQLQSSLSKLPGVLDSGVVMGTEANKELLAQGNLLVAEAQAAKADDLVIVIKAADETAAQMLPEAQWVQISVPGRYAAGVTREALRLGKHAFLFSDNVSVEDEISLK